MISRNPFLQAKRQQGAATLILAVIILLLMTIIVIYTSKVGMLELKSSSNMVRAKEAHYIAQGGLDYAVAQYAASNSLASYSENLPLSASSPAANFSVATTLNASGYIEFRSTGTGPDTTAEAVVEEQFGFVPVAGFGNLPPLMANGNFEPNGSFTIIASPDGGGTGVPVSAWAESVSSATGSWNTCNRDEYLFGDGNSGYPKVAYPDDTNPEFYTCANCQCSPSAGQLCNKDLLNAGGCSDIVDDTPDMVNTFQNLFGVDEADWRVIFDQAIQITDCNSAELDSAVGHPFYDPSSAYYKKLPVVWVTDYVGPCNINIEVGSYDEPIFLVLDADDITVGANAEIWGILFLFDNPEEPNFEVNMNGGSMIYGSVLVNSNINLGNGGYTIFYAPTILDKLSNGGAGYKLPARKPGSWKDY